MPFRCVENVRDSWEKIVDSIGISFTEARFIDGHNDRLIDRIIISDTKSSGVIIGITDE